VKLTVLTETLGWRFLFALFLSITLWARLTLDQNPERRDLYPTEINVETRGLAPGLVIVNEIQPIKLRIAAPQESWRTLEPGSFRAVVDLSDASAGLVQRDVQVEVSDPEVRVLEHIPSKVSVRIEENRRVALPVRVNQLGNIPFGFRLVGEPVVTPATVEVSGAASAVDRVSEISVSVHLDDVKSTIDRSLKPEARGPNGVVSGVRLEPQLVTVTMNVEQIAASKVVSIVPQIRGQPAPGYWQGPIVVEPASVQIAAEPSVLESVSVLNTAPLDISGAEAEVVRTVSIMRPQGVTLVGGDQSATVRVAIQPLDGQQVRDAAVTVQNIRADLTATLTPATVSVTISGPQPALQRLTVQDLVAVADLQGLGAGAHSVPVTVRLPEGLRYDRVTPERVSVTLTAPAPTPTPGATPAQ
jgi:YbbR domain-containing protein